MSKADPLVSTERLSYVYPIPPQEGHLHIVAWSSKLILTCWIIGEEIRRDFTVSINNNQDVDDLKQAMKEKRHFALQNIDASDLMLWKVRTSIVTILTLPTCKGFYTDERRSLAEYSRGNMQS